MKIETSSLKRREKKNIFLKKGIEPHGVWTLRRFDICVFGVQEEEERLVQKICLGKKITPSSPNLVKDINLGSRNSADPKQNKFKETMHRPLKVKLQQAKGKKSQKQLVKNAFSIRIKQS